MAYYRAAPATLGGMPERIGVLLVNLGTPDAATYLAVQRYLREFLSDRRVIDTPRLIWLPLLYGVVLPLRPLKSAANYRKIWLPEGSPLAVYSSRLTARIEAALRTQLNDQVRVALGMTYGKPSIATALEQLARENVKKLLVLPLYPHYCSSTTGSVFDATSRALKRVRWLPETRFVNDYHDDVQFIEAWAQQIERHWQQEGERTHLLLSYHGIPLSYVQKGDPYREQAEITTRLLVERLQLAAADYSHCYQSRFGRVEWLKPYTLDTLKALVARGVRRISVASPSFAVDCLETLQEIGIEYRDEFRHLGGESLTLVPGLNDGDQQTAALSALIGRRLAGWTAA